MQAGYSVVILNIHEKVKLLFNGDLGAKKCFLFKRGQRIPKLLERSNSAS